MSGLVRVVAVVALLAAGCSGTGGSGLSDGGGVPGSGPSSGAVPNSSGASAPNTGPTGGAPQSTTGSGGGSSTSSRPAPAQGACAAMASVRIAAGVGPDPVCLPVNGTLRLAADPSRNQPLGPLGSSNPKILSCTSQAGSGVCRPHLPGTVTVSATAGQSRWELRVNVIAYGVN